MSDIQPDPYLDELAADTEPEYDPAEVFDQAADDYARIEREA